MIKRRSILIVFSCISLFLFLTNNYFVFGKINAEPQDTWYRTYKLITGADIETDTNGNVFVTGTSYSKAKLLKFNETGDLLVNKTWEKLGISVVASAIDSQNNIIIVGYGYIHNTNNRDIFLLKYNNNCVLQWSRSWGGVEHEYATLIVIDSENNIYIAGDTYSYGNNISSFFLIKYDTSGIFRWQKIFETARIENRYSIAVDSYNDIYLPAYYYNQSLPEPIILSCLLKYNSTGDLLWNKTVPWTSQRLFIGIPPTDTIYILSEESYDTYYLINYDIEGNLIRNDTLDINFYIRGMVFDNLDNVCLFGDKKPFTPESSLYFCKINSSGERIYSMTGGGPSFDKCKGLAFDMSNNTYLLANSYNQDGESFLVIIKNPVNGLSYFISPIITSFFFYPLGLSAIITIVILIWKIYHKKDYINRK